MCSAGDCWLLFVSVARCVEFGHRGVPEVAAGNGPDHHEEWAEHGSDEADGFRAPGLAPWCDSCRVQGEPG